jgi:hypothetical protein
MGNAMGKIKIYPNFRKWQRKVYNDLARFKCLYASRRFGKTNYLKTTAILTALHSKFKPNVLDTNTLLIATENLKHCTEVYWDFLEQILCDRTNAYTYNKTKGLFIPNDRWAPHIKLAGDRNLSAGVRGLKLVKVLLDEVQEWRSVDSWDKVIYPALMDSKGHALVTGTAKGRNNTLYKIYEKFQAIPEAAAMMFDCYSDDIFTKEELDLAKLMMGLKAFQQEMECSLDVLSDTLLHAFNGLFHSFPRRPFVRSEYTNVILSIDWGSKNPAFVLTGFKKAQSMEIFKVYEPEGGLTTYDDFLEKIASACVTYEVDTVYGPDDQVPLCNSMRTIGNARGIKGMRRTEIVSRGTLGVERSYAILNSLFNQGILKIADDLHTLRQELQEIEDDGTGKPIVVTTVSETTGKKKPVRRHAVDAIRYGPGEVARRNPRQFSLPDHLVQKEKEAA